MSDINVIDVKVNLTDVEGNTINDKVKILFYNQNVSSLSKGFEVEFQGVPVVLPEIPAFPTGLAKIVITPTNYRSKAMFMNVSRDNSAINETFFVLPSKAEPKLIEFTDIADKSYGEQLLRILDKSEIDATFWNNLNKRNRATILNLSAKMFHEKIQNGQPLIELVEKIEPELLNEENRARVFARVDANLIGKLRSLPKKFKSAPGIAHHFPGNWRSFPNNSFKSRDEAGNIQFTFATNNDDLFLADIDLDDHSGIQHAFDVIKHTLSGVDTDPYDIHQILRFFQPEVDPEYLLL